MPTAAAAAPAADSSAPAGSAPHGPAPPPGVPSSGFFYGWVMLPVAALLHAGTGVGQTYGVSVFNPRIRADLGVSETDLSLVYMVACLAAAAPLPVVGYLTDRFGLRAVAVWVVTGLSLGCVLTGSAGSLLTVTLGFFLLRLLGQGALTLIAANTPAMWFRRRLGLAGGLVGLGQAASFAALPALFLFVVAGFPDAAQTGRFGGFGWRDGYKLLGLANAAVLLPVLALVYRNRPADVGQRVDGGPAAAGDLTNGESGGGPGGEPPEAPSLSARQAYRTGPFWFALTVQSVWGMIGTAVFYHLITILTDRGLTEARAATCFTVFAAAMAALQFVGGVLADRVAPRFLLSAFGALGAAGCGLLYLSTTPGVAWAFAATFGAAQGLLIATMNVLWPRFYGTAALGAIKGTVQTFSAGACAVGPVIVALSRERLGGAGPALGVFAALLLAVAALAPLLRPPARPEE